MPTPETRHRYLTLNHRIERFVFADAAERAAGSNQTWVNGEAYTIVEADIGQVAFQEDDNTYWRLTGVGPLTWLQITGTGSSGIAIEALDEGGDPITVPVVTKLILPNATITVDGTEVTVIAIG